MITILASIIGFIGSIIPEILKIIKVQKENKHQLLILDKNIELKKLSMHCDIGSPNVGHTNKRNTDIDTYYIDLLNSTVRPLLAYGFFGLYAYVKYMQYQILKSSGMLIHAAEILWIQDDQAIFVSIISFYFGQRMFNNKNTK